MPVVTWFSVARPRLASLACAAGRRGQSISPLGRYETKAVATDVELLRSNPLIPRELVVSGLVYDVDTGQVDTIVAPAPLGF